MLRDAGLWHARDVDPSDELARAAKAQELYTFLKEQRVTTADTYGALLEREVPVARRRPALPARARRPERVLAPAVVRRVRRARRRATGSATSARPTSTACAPRCCPRASSPRSGQLAGGDRIAFENYTDLLTARHFRQSVLCRAGADVAAAPAPERTERLHWAVRLKAEPLEVGLVADVFAELDRYRPRTLGFDELRERLDADPGALAEALLDGFRRERLIPHAGPLRAASEAGEFPTASRLARWQAAHGPELTSLAYTTVRMEEPAARLLITLLDGTRDRAAIRAELQARTGLELSDEDLDNNLHELARLFLMER